MAIGNTYAIYLCVEAEQISGDYDPSPGEVPPYIIGLIESKLGEAQMGNTYPTATFRLRIKDEMRRKERVDD